MKDNKSSGGKTKRVILAVLAFFTFRYLTYEMVARAGVQNQVDS